MATADTVAPAEAAALRVAAAFRTIEDRSMRGLPLCNSTLAVETVGFREHEGHAVGVLVTPWLMSLVAVPLAPDGPLAGARAGDVVALAVPSGALDLVANVVEGCGPLGTASLFSPMDEFDPETARLAAGAAIAVLFDPELLTPPAPAPKALDRRALLRGRLVDSGRPTP
ncbi:MAG: [NiFe]-hydrogenase assembly chaperone HybE [Alsobacter sp.]